MPSRLGRQTLMIGPWRSSQAGIPITNRARNVALCSKANGFFTLYEAAPDTVHPAKTLVAEADGNRTRQRRGTPLSGFEDQGNHQESRRLRARLY
jgi:hypothetical protein